MSCGFVGFLLCSFLLFVGCTSRSVFVLIALCAYFMGGRWPSQSAIGRQRPRWHAANDGHGPDGTQVAWHIRVGSVNVGSLTGRSAELVEMMGRRRLDICCLQETRWKGGQARVFEVLKGQKFKLFWSGSRDVPEKGVRKDRSDAGVGIMVAEKWIENVIEVQRRSERIMIMRVRVGSSVLNVVSAYAPQAGRPMEEKEDFYSQLVMVVSSL
jgi:hypothetical protein